MLRLLLITRDDQTLAGLQASLSQKGFSCSIISYNGALETFAATSPDIVLIEMNGGLPDAQIQSMIGRLKQEKPVPVIVLIPLDMLEMLDSNLDADDFITSPYDIRETIFRIQRLLHGGKISNSNEIIKCDGLVIDIATCEVAVAGRVVELTFKEYELLRLLASHRGRVYTREALLNKIWGYDYYGGDRTVDVHIRRLRSKIEDSRHNFIETVRNIGYRFRKNK